MFFTGDPMLDLFLFSSLSVCPNEFSAKIEHQPNKVDFIDDVYHAQIIAL